MLCTARSVRPSPSKSAAAAVQAEWKAATQAGFDACACDMNIDFCHIDFQNVSGKLLVKGIKQVNAALNQCKEARVEVSTGQTEACLDTPCSIN